VLEALFPERDVVAKLEQAAECVVAFVDSLQTLWALWAPTILETAKAVARIEKLPEVPGYEPLLIERDHHPIAARMMSYTLMRLAREETTKLQGRRKVINAIRALARRRRSNRGLRRDAGSVLEALDYLNHLEIAAPPGFGMAKFETMLNSAARGDPVAGRRAAEMASAIAATHSAARGPKTSQASFAHQLLLTYAVGGSSPSGCTWDAYLGDFTDRLTQATRLAFSQPTFDPRPARRRQRRRDALPASARFERG
jgi:hypothetical protein